MALSRGASAPDPDDDVRPLKPCLLRRNHSRDQHGVAASSLEELRSKGRLLRGPGGVGRVTRSRGAAAAHVGPVIDRFGALAFISHERLGADPGSLAGFGITRSLASSLCSGSQRRYRGGVGMGVHSQDPVH